jgi:serine/threonine protein kinase
MSKLKGGSDKPKGQSDEGKKDVLIVPKGLKSFPEPSLDSEPCLGVTEPPDSFIDNNGDTQLKPSEEYDRIFAQTEPPDSFVDSNGDTQLNPSEESDKISAKEKPDDPIPDWLIEEFESEDYVDVKRLGAGGMGEVFKARYKGNPDALGLPEDGVVAIKLVSPLYAGNDEIEKRFRQEANIVKNLEHPNIVRMFLHATLCQRPYLVMEYLKGTDLHTVIHHRASKKGTIGVERTLRIARDVCSALALAHSKGIIHRDIKPENIFIVKEGGKEVVKLIDLGLAKLADHEGMEGPKRTQTGHYAGTPFYMAQEMIPEGRERAVFNHRVDVYSMGVTMYEMLTGSLPFQAKNHFAVILQLKTNEAEPPNQRRADLDIPDDVNALVMRCLEKDPGRRYQSMEELIRAIDACGVAPCEGSLLEGLSVPESRSPAKKTFRLPENLKPLKLIVPLLATSIVVLSGALYLTFKGRPEPESRPAVQAPAAEVYHAKIQTDIPGVNVILEEKLPSGTVVPRPLGKTPLEVPLEGEQTIYLQLDGYRRMYFTVTPGNPSVTHTMIKRD